MVSLTVATSCTSDISRLPPKFIQQPNSLRSLTLTNFAIDWRILPVTLTSVTLKFDDWGFAVAEETTSFPRLAEALTKMVCLQELVIWSMYYIVPYNIRARNFGEIRLPQLRRLYIRDAHSRSPFAPSLLSKLRLPSLEHLQVYAMLNHTDHDFYNALDAIIALLVKRRNYQAIHNKPVTITLDKALQLVSRPKQEIANFTLIGAVNTYEAYMLPMMISRLASLFSDLIHFAFPDHYLEFGADALSRCFGNMPRLKAITISSNLSHIYALAKALQSCSCDISTGGAHSFPDLEVIFLCGYHSDHIRQALVEFCDALVQRVDHAPGIRVVNWDNSYRGTEFPGWAKERLEECEIRVTTDTLPKDYGF